MATGWENSRSLGQVLLRRWDLLGPPNTLASYFQSWDVLWGVCAGIQGCSSSFSLLLPSGSCSATPGLKLWGDGSRSAPASAAAALNFSEHLEAPFCLYKSDQLWVLAVFLNLPVILGTPKGTEHCSSSRGVTCWATADAKHIPGYPLACGGVSTAPGPDGVAGAVLGQV